MPKGGFVPPFPVHTFTLENGMSCILVPDAASPTVAVDISYGIGSKDDPVDRSGLAHYFEHMMFEGSANHSTNFIQKIESQGGRVNGGTARDRTQYWSIIPKEFLSELLAMESDRMANPNLDPASFTQQKGVITNERLEKYDNTAFGTAPEVLHRMLYPKGHPYHAPVIGSLEDIQKTTLEDLRRFTYELYHPRHALLALAGPIELASTEQLIRQHFAIPSGPENQKTFEPTLCWGVSDLLRDKVSYPRNYLAWHSPKAFATDDAVYDVLAYLLMHSGRGRLQQYLNKSRHLVDDVRVMQVSRKHGGLFRVDCVLPQGANTHLREVVPEGIHQVLEELSDSDLTQAKGQLKLQELLPLARSGGFGGLVDALNFYGCLLGDPLRLFQESDRYESITLADVRRCAGQLQEETVTSLLVTEGPKTFSLPNQLKDSPSGMMRKADQGSVRLPIFQPEPTVSRLLESKVPLFQALKPRQPLQSSRLCFILDEVDLLREKPYLARYLEQIASPRFAGDLEPFGMIAAAGGDFEVRIQSGIADFAILAPAGKTATIQQAFAAIVTDIKLDDQTFRSLQSDFGGRIARMRGNTDFVLEQAAKEILLGKEHEVCRLRFPTPQILPEVKKSEVLSLWKDILGQPVAVVSAGPDAVDSIQLAFNALVRSRKPFTPMAKNHGSKSTFAPQSPLTVLTLPEESGPQIDLSIIVKTPGLSAGLEHHAAMVILEDALAGGVGGRLEQALRRLGPVSYGIRSNFVPYQDAGLMILSAAIATPRAREAATVLLDELKALQSGERPLLADEIENAARRYLARSFPAFETAQNHTAKLRQLVSLGLPLDHFEMLWEQVRMTTKDPNALNLLLQKSLNQGVALTFKGSPDDLLPIPMAYRHLKVKLGDDLAPQFQDS